MDKLEKTRLNVLGELFDQTLTDGQLEDLEDILRPPGKSNGENGYYRNSNGMEVFIDSGKIAAGEVGADFIIIL